jgi:hypothetical protein
MKTDWQNVHSKVQEKRKKVTFNTMQIIAFGFLGVIFLGSILLYLPISNQEPIAYLDALFVSVSAVCVTGLVTVFPAARFFSFTNACSFSICVDPQFVLIFTPSGSLLITYVFAPSASYTLFAMLDELPLAQSRPIFISLKERVASEIRCPM